MAVRALLIDSGPGETRIARVDDGRLREIWFDRARTPNRVGAIFLGRVTRVEAGLDAAFVDLGLDRPGFLRTKNARLQEGQAIVVQVDREAEGDKGVRLTAAIDLAGNALVLTPGRKGVVLSRRIADPEERRRLQAILAGLADGADGLIARTRAAGMAADRLEAEAASLRAAWAAIQAAAKKGTAPMLLHENSLTLRVLRDQGESLDIVRAGRPVIAAIEAWCRAWAPDLLDRIALHRGPEALFAADEVEAQVEAALSRTVPVPGGGRLVFDQAEAMAVIDVDSGSASVPTDAERAALAVNVAAADEIARQLRLRGIGGTVVVDFVSMRRAENRRAVRKALEQALEDDPDAGGIHEMPGLGLVGFTRRRSRPPLAAILGEACDMCGGSGWRPSARTIALATLRQVVREAAATPGGAIVVQAAPDVADAVEIEAPALGSLAARIRLERDEQALRDDVTVTVERR